MAVNVRTSTGSWNRLLEETESRGIESMSPHGCDRSSTSRIDVTPMHIGGVSIFEGPPPPFEELRAMVESKLDLDPALSPEGPLRAPSAWASRLWVDDPHFNLDYHLRHSAFRRPGATTQLRATAARVFSQHLDRIKPLWEIWMVQGLDEDRWALLSKVHHCMVDGVAATDMMSLMFGERPEATNGEVWHPDPEPTGIDLIAYSASIVCAIRLRRSGSRSGLRARC